MKVPIFNNDPTTSTDDFIAGIAGVNDLVSTLTGGTVSIVSAIAPIVICLNPNVPEMAKVASLGGGSLGTAAGALLGRQRPDAWGKIRGAAQLFKQELKPPDSDPDPSSGDEGQF